LLTTAATQFKAAIAKCHAWALIADAVERRNQGTTIHSEAGVLVLSL
jgi:hypothetical protein